MLTLLERSWTLLDAPGCSWALLEAPGRSWTFQDGFDVPSKLSCCQSLEAAPAAIWNVENLQRNTKRSSNAPGMLSAALEHASGASKLAPAAWQPQNTLLEPWDDELLPGSRNLLLQRSGTLKSYKEIPQGDELQRFVL